MPYSMREILRHTFAPVFSLFIIMLGVSFFNTFVSVRVTIDGWSNFTTGLVYSAYYGGMMVGAIYMEQLIKYTGHIRSFSMFASLAATSIILQGFTESPFSWIFFRFATGLACAGLFIVIESWLLLLSSPNTRGTILSIYMVALYTAQSLGQFILNFVDIQSPASFNLAVVFCSISLIPVCLMRAAAPPLTSTEYINIFYMLRKIPLGFFGNFVAGLILSSFYALGPVFAKEMGLSVFQISLVMGVTIFGGMALQWPIGLLSDLIERRKAVIIVGFVLMVLSLILFFFDRMPFYLLITLLFFYGGFSFTIYPISITYCCDFFSAASITTITCAALIVYGIGCIIGPMLSPLIMEVTKPSGLFLYSATLSLFLALFALWRQHKLPRESKETKESYQVITTVSPKVSELDPRKEE